MDKVSCKCQGCGAKLGVLVNLWIQVGKTYYSPVIPHDPLKTKQQGVTRTGSSGTLVANCELQDLICIQCDAVVAIQCLTTPINHVLTEGQILLHLAKVAMVKRGGAEIKLVVQRKLKLRDNGESSAGVDDFEGMPIPGNTPSSSKAGAYHSITDRIQEEIQIQRRDIDRIDNAGHQIVREFDTAVTGIQLEVRQAKDSLYMLRSDLDQTTGRATVCEEDVLAFQGQLESLKENSINESTVECLGSQLEEATKSITTIQYELQGLASSTATKSQVTSTKAELSKMKKEIWSLRSELTTVKSAAAESIAATEEYAKLVTMLRSELGQTKKELERERTAPARQASNNSVFPNREIEILTSNIAKISNRASKVETLEMELELMKGRLQRLEANSGDSPTPTPTPTPIPIPISNISLTSDAPISVSQKRPAGMGTPGLSSATSKGSKRQAVSQHLNIAPIQYDEFPSSPVAMTPTSDTNQQSGRPRSSSDQWMPTGRKTTRRSQFPKKPFGLGG